MPDEKQQLKHKIQQTFFFCSGSKMLSVGYVVSKSKYITKGKSPFELTLPSKLIKLFVLKL